MPTWSRPQPSASDLCVPHSSRGPRSGSRGSCSWWELLWLPPLASPCVWASEWVVDRFTKTFFWNFQSIQADLCYILIYKQMLEKAFCSNIAPSLSSGNHLFYKAEYMGRHLNLVSGVSLKRSFRMQFRNAYFRSLVHSSRKLWPKPD